MPQTIAQLHETLTSRGWVSGSAAFGSQRWTKPAEDGRVEVHVDLKHGGIVASVRRYVTHHDPEDGDWDTEVATLEFGPAEGFAAGLRINRSEDEIAALVSAAALLVDTPVEGVSADDA